MSSVLHTGNCLEILPGLPEQSVHCVVTSPPYFGLRDYGVKGQLGLEKTPDEYINNLVNIFREIWWVLRDDGTCWLNLGDSFANNSNGAGPSPTSCLGSGPGKTSKYRDDCDYASKQIPDGLKPKDLMGIPWRVALALQADGWYLRSDIIEEVELYCPCGCGYTLEERIWRHSPDREIIWHKPNPMPESVTDRPTKSHEYIFLLTKSEKYFYDSHAIREASIDPESLQGRNPRNNDRFAQSDPDGKDRTRMGFAKIATGNTYPTRNKRSVWTVATQPMKDAHFATFPQELIKPCILAGTSQQGCCAKCGTPWERVVEKGDIIHGDGHSRPNNRVKIDEKNYDAWSRPDGLGKTQIPGAFYPSKTTGFRPACICYKPGPPVPCTVLDPFNGAGTTGVVCKLYNRNYIGIDLKQEYIKMSQDRLNKSPDYKDTHDAFLEKLEKALAIRLARRAQKKLKPL